MEVVNLWTKFCEPANQGNGSFAHLLFLCHQILGLWLNLHVQRTPSSVGVGRDGHWFCALVIWSSNLAFYFGQVPTTEMLQGSPCQELWQSEILLYLQANKLLQFYGCWQKTGDAWVRDKDFLTQETAGSLSSMFVSTLLALKFCGANVK